jgi:hypothetical protein
MKKSIRILLLCILWNIPYSLAQAPAEAPPRCPAIESTTTLTKAEMAFCEKDSSPEVMAFCENLANLLRYAKKNPGVNTQCFRGLEDNLDLTGRKGVDHFITATALTFATKAAISNALQTADQQRPDQELGANSNASGTASLVSKAGSTELLSFALDTGVVTQSVNGTTSTLSTNADQIFRLITKSDPDCIVNCKSLGWFEDNVLNRITLSGSLSLSQHSSSTTPTSGQASGTTPTQVSEVSVPTGVGKLSGITARYEVLNKFDPRSGAFKTAWAKKVPGLATQVKTIGTDTDAVSKALSAHEPFESDTMTADQKAKRDNLVPQMLGSLGQAAVEDPSGQKLVTAFESFWNQFVTSDVKNDSALAAAVSKVMQDRGIYRQAWLKVLQGAVGNLFTFEYNYNRPANQPETHDFKLIYAYNFKTMGMVTFNGSASIYGTTPAGAKYGNLHYGQVSTEYDQTLSGNGKSVQTQLSLAGYWQYQPHPSVLNIAAGTVAPGTDIPVPNGTQEFVGTAGSLWVTQAKLTIKGSGGINVPIGVSWSNKTDLLQGSKVGAQVGLSYNFSSLAGLFTGGSSQ